MRIVSLWVSQHVLSVATCDRCVSGACNAGSNFSLNLADLKVPDSATKSQDELLGLYIRLAFKRWYIAKVKVRLALEF